METVYNGDMNSGRFFTTLPSVQRGEFRQVRCTAGGYWLRPDVP